MKKQLFVFFVTGAILTINLNEKIAYADDTSKKEVDASKEKYEEKIEPISIPGKLVKSDDDYVLLNKERGGIVLPKITDKNSKISYDEWLGKMISVSGKGIVSKIEKEGNIKEIITFTIIESIKLYDAK